MMLFFNHQPVQSFPSKTSGSRYFLQHNIYKIWRGSDESQVEWGCDSERELRWFVVFLLVSGLKGLAKSCVRVLNSYEEILALGWIPRKQSKENETKSYSLLFGLVQFFAWVKWVSTIRSIVLLDVCLFFFFAKYLVLKMIFVVKFLLQLTVVM